MHEEEEQPDTGPGEGERERETLINTGVHAQRMELQPGSVVTYLCFVLILFWSLTLNHVLGILCRYTAVREPFGPASRMHAGRRLVHVVVVDHLAPEHGSA